MVNVLFVLIACLLISGCATSVEVCKQLAGISTKELEDARKDAAVRVLEYGYKDCYARTERILKALEYVSIYACNEEMIALYYIDPNTTPVGIFFKEIDASHTRIEVTSADSNIKETVAILISSTEPEEKIIEKASKIKLVK